MSDEKKPDEAAPDWAPLELDSLRARLVEVRDLLQQAAAAGLAQDLDKLEAITKLAQERREEIHGTHGRRRYR
jgi:hypothetical protein